MADGGAPGDMAASIAEMQALLLGTETIQEFLTELAGLAIATVGEGLSCGITWQPGGRLLTMALSTHDRGWRTRARRPTVP